MSIIRCNVLQSLKKFCEGVQSHLKFSKIKVGSEPPSQNFLNFEKSGILSCQLQFDNNKWGSPSSFLSYRRSKLKLRAFSAGHIVDMAKIIPTCSPVIGQFFDTMIVASIDKEW